MGGCCASCISGALPSTEDIFHTAPWIRTYYSSPKPKVTDAPMSHLLLKAPNKYLPDLTQWVMTEHTAWQIMQLRNFKLCIFDADSGADVGWASKTPLPWTMSLACETVATSIMQCEGSGEPRKVPSLWDETDSQLTKPAHIADASNHAFLDNT